MSNELLDDPMDTGAPAGGSADVSRESNSTGTEDPVPPTFDVDREVPLEIVKSHVMRLEEKRDKEVFDEVYDLSVPEPAMDVEALACNYDGNAFFIRGRFIAKHCPSLRADAYIVLINYLKEHTLDITHYMAFFNELESELSRKEFKNNKCVNLQLPTRDAKWIEETGAAWQIALDQYQAEYKRHKDEGVKESTRRAMEDLFHHFVIAGKVEDAMRLYSRGIRDYCTQLKHSINMWLNWIEVSICGNDWNKLESITSTAFRSLKDADDAEKNNQQQQRGENTTYLVERDTGGVSSLTNRQLIEAALAKCLTAQTLLKLKAKKYSQVVDTILQIRTECLQPKWFVTTSDLGVYAVLCAMATLERTCLKQLVGGNGQFRKLLESEPLFIDLLNSYTSSRFGRCFEIMKAVKSRLLLDPFISRNVDELFEKIRQKCVIQYLQPYSTVKIETMCEALGTNTRDLQNTIMELVESKSVLLRIDRSAGIIRMIDEKDENETLKRVGETCDRALLRAKSLLWKTTLASANIHTLSDKETRQKRKNQRDAIMMGRPDRNVIDLDDTNDDFQMSFDHQQQLQQQQQQLEHDLEDLGDI